VSGPPFVALFKRVISAPTGTLTPSQTQVGDALVDATAGAVSLRVQDPTTGVPVSVSLQTTSSGGGSFVFVQAVPLAVWVVAHNLGFRPSVSVTSTAGVEVICEVFHVDNNVLECRFNVAFAGQARCV
jgi:hypothetical protein